MKNVNLIYIRVVKDNGDSTIFVGNNNSDIIVIWIYSKLNENNMKILSSMRRPDTAKHYNVKSYTAFTCLLQLAIIDKW